MKIKTCCAVVFIGSILVSGMALACTLPENLWKYDFKAAGTAGDEQCVGTKLPGRVTCPTTSTSDNVLFVEEIDGKGEIRINGVSVSQGSSILIKKNEKAIITSSAPGSALLRNENGDELVVGTCY